MSMKVNNRSSQNDWYVIKDRTGSQIKRIFENAKDSFICYLIREPAIAIFRKLGTRYLVTKSSWSNTTGSESADAEM